MRYVDPQPHIRLRIRGDSNELYKILTSFNNLVPELKDKFIVK